MDRDVIHSVQRTQQVGKPVSPKALGSRLVEPQLFQDSPLFRLTCLEGGLGADTALIEKGHECL